MSKIDSVNYDFDRKSRLGFCEAILCGHKSTAQVEQIIRLLDSKAESAILTRLTPSEFHLLDADVQTLIDYDALSCTGFVGKKADLQKEPPVIAVVSAGTSDLSVAREACRTLEFNGNSALEVYDVGVAGLWRLLERKEELEKMKVVIVCAGMDGALPSVVAGLIPGVVVAVPTSIGYGVAKEGNAALKTMLSSCAPGLVVVNIDNGYGAACSAMRCLNIRA